MATEYCRSMLRICIAQLCQNLGWNATQSSPLELLTDILERYLIDLGKISHRYSEQFGRTEPNLDDLALTFRHYGIQLGELEDYIRHVEPVAFAREVVSFPARKRNNLGFPNSRSRELLQHREEHVHNHLPYMYPGMEDEVEEESSQASLPTPQLPQESVSPMAISPTPSDKRPLSNSAEGPPSKRPRLISSNLPEEAGHSQYEMKGLLMNPSGVLTPTRQGKLPDARTPPTFRQSLQFKDEGGQKGRENKEDTPSRPPFSEKPGRQDEEDNRDKSNNCLEKVAPKKKMLKHYKQMTAADTASGMPRSPKVTKLVRSPKPGSPLGTKSPKQKQKAKTKEKIDKREEAVSGGNLPAESCLKDLLLSPKVNIDKVEKTRVSSPLAASPKIKPDSKEKHKDKKEKKSRGNGQDKVSKPLPENQTKQPGSGDLPSRTSDVDVSSQLPFTVEEDSSNSRDYSPERLVIAEGDTKVKNTKEARQARLALIDDSIDSVIRNSVAEVDKKIDTFTFTDDSEMKMSPKPVKGKKKDKSKVGKESEHKPKKKDKKEKSDSQSIADSIDAVIRQSSEENELVSPALAPASTPAPAPAPAPAPPVSAVSEVVVKEVPELPPPVKTASPLVMPELGTKKFGKDKSDKKQKKKTSGKKKEKESTAKDKLKDKLKVKSEKQDLSELDKKPSVLDKFSAQEYSVYDFPESPPSLPPRPRKATPKSGTSPKQSLPPSNPPPAPTPLPTPPPPLPPPPPPPVTTPAAPPPPPPPTKDEPPLTPTSDQPPLMTLKILDLKHKQKDKERSKDKEHKKEKKEKKKDKEKKKKNKDKDKEKSRDKSKSREDKHKEDKDLPASSPVGGLVAPIKLNIKFGGPGGSSAATSTVITEPKITSPKPEPLPVSPKTPRPEPLLSPKREIPKLVIKPIRRESLEAKAKLGAASRSPAIMSPPKSPPPPPVTPSPATTPALPPLTAPPAPVPAPSPLPPSPLPPPKIKTPPKSPTPPPPSPPKPKTPPPSPPPPTPSPPPPPKSPTPPPRSPTPPPRSPTPEKLITPSPEPKLHTPQSSPIRKSPTPEPTSPPHKSPTPVKRSPPSKKKPSPRIVPSPKSSPPSSPLTPRLEMDIDHEEEPIPKPKPKPKPSKQSPKGKADKGDKSDRSDKGDKSDKSDKGDKSDRSDKGDKSDRSDKGDKSDRSDKGDKSEKSEKGEKADTKPSPKGKRGRKPKEKEEKEEPKAAVRSRNKSIPTVTSETVSETPITGPIVQRTVVAETIGTFLDAEGNKVWICPACKMQDDGSPMIGCDVCDDWYHWVCMDIKQEPEEDEWFCPRCEETKSKSKTPKGKPKGKKRGRKKKT